MSLAEGWYLMSASELERELGRHRGPGRDLPPTGAPRLTVEEALAYRDAGNLPDGAGRSLRLVLRIDHPADLAALDVKRRAFEPDYLEPPRWRRPGSVPVNIVPLRAAGVGGDPGPWWERPELAELEREWAETGRAGGIAVPADLRGFVYKTILALRAAQAPVTPEAVAGGIARWVGEDDAAAIRARLVAANGPRPSPGPQSGARPPRRGA